MYNMWRLMDTGVRRAAENFAINRAIMESHKQGKTINTLRFLAFPPSALIGFHQDVEQELNLEYIRDNNIDIQRRLSGGGAIYMDELQIGWELYLEKQVFQSADMSAVAQEICDCVAAALNKLGMSARFRPRNDIEVNGRKISGTGGIFDGNTVVYQGTVLVDFDVEKMMRVLRIPAEKINDKSIADARERVITVRELLADKTPSMETIKQAIAEVLAKHFDIQWQVDSEMNTVEKDIYQKSVTQIDSDKWLYQHERPLTDAPLVESMYRSNGGLIKTTLIYDRQKNMIKQLWITGDFFIRPQRLVVDLEAALKNTRLNELEKNVSDFFANYESELLLLEQGDFVQAIKQAVDSLQE
ncbi:MAG: lipoate--protein ligase family protein [Gammaproteobacteria bacterium]|nr:lipoate--protein ligase family protein [Gammaproteobacteria bacterium]